MRKPSSLTFDIFKCGLMGEFRRQTYKIKEQSNLRKGSKDYLRIFNQNNLITKIDSLSIVFFNSAKSCYLFIFLRFIYEMV